MMPNSDPNMPGFFACRFSFVLESPDLYSIFAFSAGVYARPSIGALLSAPMLFDFYLAECSM